MMIWNDDVPFLKSDYYEKWSFLYAYLRYKNIVIIVLVVKNTKKISKD